MKIKTGLWVVTSIILLFTISTAFAQKVNLSGVVKDKQTGEALPGANVFVKDKFVGTTANNSGNFELSTKVATPFTLVVSMVGYETIEMEITGSVSGISFEMEQSTFMANDIVVSASRIEESILSAPVTVEKLDQLAIRRTPSVTFYDGLANMKEIEMTANSMVFSGPTGRGFGSSHNSGLIQLIDGVDNTGIANGSYAIGNMMGLSDIDVAEVEFLPGASSALYGPNAFSGVLFINSKSPFDYPGLSVQVKSGGTDSEYGGSHALYEGAFRFAKAYEKFAFKVVGSHFQATDWMAHDYSDRNKGSRGPAGFDGVNIYGDEVATTLNLDDLAGTPEGTLGSIFIARTGYREEELYDYKPASTSKVNLGLRYRLSEDLEASYDFRWGTGRAIYQGTNRYALDNLFSFWNKLELKGQNFWIRTYMQREDAGDSYDIVFAGWNVNRQWKSDTQWFTDYATTYIGAKLQGLPDEAAHQAARGAADTGRFEPGSPEFNQALEKVKDTKDFATGAGFTSKSGYYNAEAMYNFADMIDFVDIQVGGNVRNYSVNTEGTIYSDDTEKIDVTEFGIYAQASKELFDNKFKLTGSLRLDGHKNFDDHVSPRIAAVFSPTPDHHFRASYQSGFNNPIIEFQYINLNLGPLVLVGGTEDNVQRTGNERIYASGIDIATMQPVKTPFVKPEFQESFEIGYRALISNSLFVDLNYYRSDYTDRFKNVRVLDPAALQQGKIQAYQLYTNEVDENVVIEGVGAGFTYTFENGFRLNGSYNYINRSGGSDDALSSINRAKHRVKASIGNPRLFKNFGFNVAGRWRDEFDWVATFGEGEVGGETVIDAQVTYHIPRMNSTLKAGVNNLTGSNYRQMFGSVDIGTTIYLSLSYDSFF
ncbi:MAG: TonB-dependent receptor domain-containing protein [bacterium]